MGFFMAKKLSNPSNDPIASRRTKKSDLAKPAAEVRDRYVSNTPMNHRVAQTVLLLRIVELLEDYGLHRK